MRSLTNRTSIGLGLISKNGIKAYLESVMSALWYTVDGTSMLDMFGGDPLTLSADPGTTYIPSDYEGTITAPDVAGLKTADVNNVLYTAGGDANDLSVSDFIDADLERIPVYYDSSDPYHIRMIGLFDPTAYLTLTDADKIKISNYMKLWIFYWDALLGGVIKDNRAIGSNPELNTLANATSPVNEANATTGFLSYGLDGTGANIFESQSSVKTNGSYALHADANDTPTNVCGFYLDLQSAPFNIVDGNSVTISFDIRHIGTGGIWASYLTSAPNGTIHIIGSIISTTFETWEKTWTHDSSYRYLTFRELSVTNDGGVYVDNLSVKINS